MLEAEDTAMATYFDLAGGRGGQTDVNRRVPTPGGDDLAEMKGKLSQDRAQTLPEARHCSPDCTFSGTGREATGRGVGVLVFH
jgi:hypothetical protein